MAEEEALGGNSDPWVSSKGSGVVPEVCPEGGLQEASGEGPGLSPLVQPSAKPSAEMQPVPILFSPFLKNPLLPQIGPGLRAVRPLPHLHV